MIRKHWKVWLVLSLGAVAAAVATVAWLKPATQPQQVLVDGPPPIISKQILRGDFASNNNPDN